MSLYLGACQTNVLTDEAELDSLLNRLAEQPGPCLWLLPELFFGGFEMKHRDRWTSATPLVSMRITEFVHDTRHALAGSLWERREGEYLNTLFVFRPQDRAPVRLYSKIHLFPASEEPLYITPGKPHFTPVSWERMTLGGCICFDLRFPEIFRVQAPTTNIYLVCAQWPAARTAHWQALVTARAIENQAWVLAVNACGDSPLGTLGGHSRLISPTGETLFACKTEPDLKQAATSLAAEADASRLFSSKSTPYFRVSPAKIPE